MRNTNHRTRERGASMVEFAMVLPLFMLLLFGIMESGWYFSQQVEVRNAAREGGRLAVVDYPNPGSNLGDPAIPIVNEVCARSGLAEDTIAVTVTRVDGDPLTTVDDSARVTVSNTYTSLTGFLPFFNGTISSTAEMRLERDVVTWSNISDQACS